uniref:Putative transposase n=1 Tax=viral metagenome TaxID=1070528 RepID=A0A6H2A252_9ZZZZ
MRKTFRYRLYPAENQKKKLQFSLDACRWVYNKTLEIRKQAWEERKESLSRYDTSNLLTQWKQDNQFLDNAYSQCLQNVTMRVDLAFRAFFRRIKAKETPGYPRFRGFDRYDSFTFPQSGFGFVGDKLRLSKVGSVKIRKHRNIEGTVKTLTIQRTSTDKWYACFACEIEHAPLTVTDAVVGIDVGLESFATFSNGDKIENPRFFKTDEKKLAKVQRKFSKAKNRTPERKKLKKAVAHVYEKIINKRNDFAHQLSRKLINKYQIIAFEKLNIKQMRKNGFKGIRKSIGDVAWGQFTQFTTYKAEEAGRQVVFVNPRNTSKMCSRCGQLVEKTLSDRIHHCSCGLVLDRDHNASLNILRLGMESLA